MSSIFGAAGGAAGGAVRAAAAVGLASRKQNAFCE